MAGRPHSYPPRTLPRTNSRTPSPPSTPIISPSPPIISPSPVIISPSPKGDINPPTSVAWGVETTTASSYRTQSFVPNLRFASGSPAMSCMTHEQSVEQHIDQTIRLFSAPGLTSPDSQAGFDSGFETRDGWPTNKTRPFMPAYAGAEEMHTSVMQGPQEGWVSRKEIKHRGTLYKGDDERGSRLEACYSRYDDHQEQRTNKNGTPYQEKPLVAYDKRERLQQARQAVDVSGDDDTPKARFADDLQGQQGRRIPNHVSGSRQQGPYVTSDGETYESIVTHPAYRDNLPTIPNPDLKTATSFLINRGNKKLTSTRHNAVDTQVTLESKWAAEDAEWARLEDRRQAQLRQKSLEHRELMLLRERESKAEQDLRFAVDLHARLDAATADPNALAQLPEICAPPGSSPTTVALYENSRQAVERVIHSDRGQRCHGDRGALLAKARTELDESISKDEARAEREKQKEFEDRLAKARKPDDWKRVQAVRAVAAQREQQEGARGRFRTWSQEDLELPDEEVQATTLELEWRKSIAGQDGGYEATLNTPSLSSLRTVESGDALLDTPFASEDNSDDNIITSRSPSLKPRRLEQDAARLRDFNIVDDDVVPPPAPALPIIPVIPRGPQPFFGSFFTPYPARPGPCKGKKLDKDGASLDEASMVVKKTKKWDLFAKPIPALLPSTFGKFSRRSHSPRGSHSPVLPTSRSVEYKMTLLDMKIREGQTPDDLRREREQVEKYLVDNDIPFEYHKDVLERRQSEAEETRRANLTGGQSPTRSPSRSPSRKSARLVRTITASTESTSTTDRAGNKRRATVRKLFSPNVGSTGSTGTESLHGCTPEVVITSTTPPPNTAPGYLSPTKTTLSRGRPVSSPTTTSSAMARPSSPTKTRMVSKQNPRHVPVHTALHPALAARRLSPMRAPVTDTKSAPKDTLMLDVAELKFRLQKVEMWAKGVKENMHAAGLEKEWQLLDCVTRSRVVGAGGTLGPNFADWDVEMRLREGLGMDK